jgi:hypothetical protein
MMCIEPGTRCATCAGDAKFINPDLPENAYCSQCYWARFGPPKILMQSELNRLVQGIHDLRVALRPFAQFADLLPPIIEGHPRITDSGPAFNAGWADRSATITFADLRWAAALLQQLEAADIERHIADAEKKMAAAPLPGGGVFGITTKK